MRISQRVVSLTTFNLPSCYSCTPASVVHMNKEPLFSVPSLRKLRVVISQSIFSCKRIQICGPPVPQSIILGPLRSHRREREKEGFVKDICHNLLLYYLCVKMHTYGTWGPWAWEPQVVTVRTTELALNLIGELAYQESPADFRPVLP